MYQKGVILDKSSKRVCTFHFLPCMSQKIGLSKDGAGEGGGGQQLPVL